MTQIPANSVFYPLLNKQALHDGLIQPIQVHQTAVLVVQQGHKVHVIESKCGHFGVPLDTASVTETTITCPVHGFSFDLVNGRPVNREWENCDPITVFRTYWQGDTLGLAIIDGKPTQSI